MKDIKNSLKKKIEFMKLISGPIKLNISKCVLNVLMKVSV